MGEQAADVVDALALRGFSYLGRADDGLLRFSGELRAQGKGHACDVLVDPGFVELPLVRLHRVPESLPKTVEHMSHDGLLCYLTSGTFVVDIFDPVGQTLAFVERAQYVLAQILKRELVADLEDEFIAYWTGLPFLFDLQHKMLGRQDCLLIGEPEIRAMAVTDNVVRTQSKLKIMGLESSTDCVPAYRVQSSSRPRPSQGDWPPKTLGELLRWQQGLDPNCRKNVQRRLNEAMVAKQREAVFVIQSPLMAYGFFAFLDKGDDSKRNCRGQEYLWSCPVFPLSMYRIDARYISERNVPSRKSLAGKNIVVVGCGTIGGFLADMLVKAGAGNDGGALTLVDNDNLYPQNLGRHRLGFSKLLKNKAIALAEELSLQAPDATVRSLPLDIRLAHLGSMDLLIDATGEEAITHWISRRYVSQVPLLTVWVEGPGTAVRTLLRTDERGACPRCLFRHTREGRYQSVKGGPPQIYAGQGCEGVYVPFSATVSVQAAALGADGAVDWVNGVRGPALRTRLTDSTHTLETEDCSPAAFEDCPACSM